MANNEPAEQPPGFPATAVARSLHLLEPLTSTLTPEHQVLCVNACAVLMIISSVARDCILHSAGTSNIVSNVHVFINSLSYSDENSGDWSPSDSMGVPQLAQLAKRYRDAEIVEAQVHMVYWTSTMMFAAEMNQ